MRGVIAYFIKYPLVANLLMFFILIFGIIGLFSLKSTFFPETESSIININVTYPGASPEEMEEGIILKIEDNLKGITGIDRISSDSRENSASVTVEVQKGYDTDLVLQDVKNAVDRISSFPTGMEPPEVFKRENLNLAIKFALSGDVNLSTLKKNARDIENQLRGVEGISKVSLSGFPEEEIEISVRETDLLAYGITFDELDRAVKAANIDITGGTVKGEEEEMLIRARSKEYYARELKDIVVKTKPDGQIVKLQDVATVRDKWAENPNRSYINGLPAVVISVQNTIHEDILEITEYIRNFVKEYNEEHEQLKATIINDRSITLRQRIELLVDNGLKGLILVFILLALFLNIRLAFWVAIAIPISFMGMFIVASFYGLTINVISLFGMIVVIGILVDDGIVISENIYQHYERGKSPIRAAIDGTMEVLPPVTAAILTTVVAFSTFFFLDGRMGEFIIDMAFVVILTLIFSLIEGAFILPEHVGHSRALRVKGQKNSLNRFTDKIMAYMRDRIYGRVLRFAIYNKALSIAIAIGLFMISIAAVKGGFVKTTFFPALERDNIAVEIEMPAGTREDVTEKWLTHVENVAWEVNKELSGNRADTLQVVENIERTVGPSSHIGSLSIGLLDSERRNMEVRQITNMIRERAGKIYGAEKVTYGESSPWGKPISVALLGSDPEELTAAKDELRSKVEELSSVKDVVDNDQPGLREIDISLKENAFLLGLTLRDVMNQVRSGFFGLEAQRLQRGQDEVKIWVRYLDRDRNSISDLENMRIRTADGSEYPLGEIANFDIRRGTMAIHHLDGRREVKIEADLATSKESATDIIFEIQSELLPPILAKYPGVEASFEGQSREAMKTMKSGKKIIPIIIILMIGIVMLTFRSVLQTFIIFLILPFGFIGVVTGHFIHDFPISVLSMYGIIALIGIMVNDSLVLVTAMNNLLKEGKGFMEAVYEAGLSRFRPILLTSLTTIAGLGPLILEKSFQAQFLIPMAISVAYGMIIATVVTLVVLPVMLVVISQLRVHMKWLWTGRKPTLLEMEPAVKEMKNEYEEQ